jgi:hypothetical protein
MRRRTFDAQSTDMVEVIAVDMRVDAEETAYDGTDGVAEVLGERNT